MDTYLEGELSLVQLSIVSHDLLLLSDRERKSTGGGDGGLDSKESLGVKAVRDEETNLSGGSGVD